MDLCNCTLTGISRELVVGVMGYGYTVFSCSMHCNFIFLYTLGSRHIQTRLVEPSAKSLNSGDVFVLVTPKEIHLWNGKDASIMKKAKVCLIVSS